jgi:ABC-type Fe3+ transport system substrate-binding protein
METYDMKPEAPLEYRGIFQPIKTNVSGMEICELLPLQAKIALEARTGQHSWDVHNAGTVNMIPENLALQFEPPNAKDIMPEARDPNKRWYGVYAGYSVPQYNTNLVKPDELPKTYEDFLTRKQWVGKLAIEATDRDWMDAVLQFYGRDKGLKLLRDIQATLKPVVLDGHFAMARQIAAGEYPIALMNYSMLTTNLKQQGAPTEYVALDPVHLWFGMVGVNKNAPHPNAAKLAANFLLSREAQEFSAKIGGRVPTRLDVESNPKDLRQRMNEKKVIFLQHTAEQAKASFKGEDDHFIYSRYSNPSVSMFEERLRLLEGTKYCQATASVSDGQASLTA